MQSKNMIASSPLKHTPMKKTYTLYKTLTVAVLTIFLASCKKNFLDTIPRQQTDADLVIKDLPGTRAAMIGTYSLLQSEAYYGRTLPILPELMSDQVYLSRKNSNRYQSYDQYGVATSDSYASETWSQIYRVIVNANILIAKAEALDYPATEVAEAQHIIGEAYTARALAHFDLVRLFAMPYNYTADAGHMGIPIILKSGYDKADLQTPKRNTVKEVYAQVIDDLKKAITLMPEKPVGFALSNKGHLSVFAAKSLLARVYLYQGDWINAEKTATEVIGANKYTLLARDKYVEDYKKQNNTETIFEVQYNTTNNLGSNALVNFCLQTGSYGDALATDDLYAKYTATDVRRSFMVIGKRNSSGAENPAVLITKFNNITTFEEGIKVFRLSELYLIRAEARAKQAGMDALAAKDLDVVAQRADAAKTATTLTGTALQDLIIAERRKEFAFEGHRLFDLTRNKLGFTKYRSGATITIENTSLKTILPIPLSERNANPSIEQNEGYK